jgi:hypothetical protein
MARTANVYALQSSMRPQRTPRSCDWGSTTSLHQLFRTGYQLRVSSIYSLFSFDYITDCVYSSDEYIELKAARRRVQKSEFVHNRTYLNFRVLMDGSEIVTGLSPESCQPLLYPHIRRHLNAICLRKRLYLYPIRISSGRPSFVISVFKVRFDFISADVPHFYLSP